MIFLQEAYFCLLFTYIFFEKNQKEILLEKLFLLYTKAKWETLKEQRAVFVLFYNEVILQLNYYTTLYI